MFVQACMCTEGIGCVHISIHAEMTKSFVSVEAGSVINWWRDVQREEQCTDSLCVSAGVYVILAFICASWGQRLLRFPTCQPLVEDERQSHRMPSSLHSFVSLLFSPPTTSVLCPNAWLTSNSNVFIPIFLCFQSVTRRFFVYFFKKWLKCEYVFFK